MQCLCYSFFPTQDVDECMLDMDECDELAACINTIGSYNCVCEVGYTGDGYNCTGYF